MRRLPLRPLREPLRVRRPFAISSTELVKKKAQPLVEMEPEWTKKISSNTVCTTYYYIFVIYAILAVLAVIGTIGILFAYKLPKGLSVGLGFQGLLTAGIAATLALFQYLVCSRALLGEQIVELKKVPQVQM